MPDTPDLKGWILTKEGWINISHISMVRQNGEITVGAGEVSETITDQAAAHALLERIKTFGIIPEEL